MPDVTKNKGKKDEGKKRQREKEREEKKHDNMAWNSGWKWKI